MNKKTIIWVSVVALAVALIAGAVGYYFYQKSANNETPDQTETIEEETFRYPEPDVKSSKNAINGPYYHGIYSAKSQDGKSWETNSTKLFDHSSVPGAVMKDGVIYLYFVDASGDEDQLSLAISRDNGETFEEKKRAHIKNVYHYDAVDPHPELIDGKIVLYFLGDFMSMPKGPIGEPQNQEFTIYSAVSDDGLNFNDLKATVVFDNITTDPDIFKIGNEWNMLVSQEQELSLLKSSDPREGYVENPDFSWEKGGVCETYEIDGIFYTYYCGDGLSYATGIDNGKLITAGSVISGSEAAGDIVCDPTIVQLPDKSYLMFYKRQPMPEKTEPM